VTDDNQKNRGGEHDQPVTRRQFMKIAGVTAVGGGAQLMIIGCGSGSPAATSDGGAAADGGAYAGAGGETDRVDYPVVGPHRYIDESLCVGCGQCVRLCPMGAISLSDGTSSIDASECAECNVCIRAAICPANAIKTAQLEWPRVIRSLFSDPLSSHESTRVPGRGTEEIKTNDSKNIYGTADLGVVIDIGRPALGARFVEVEKIVKKFKASGYDMVEHNPLAGLVVDESGSLDPEVLNEKVISCIAEYVIPREAAGELMRLIEELSAEVKTVFNVCVALRADDQGDSPLEALFESGVFRLPNGKVNLGLAVGITPGSTGP
jgi:ferredoxin